ncbi:MAG: hypothetical protein ACEPOV_14815 [Hyphomicrobiales bacterium]
MNNPIVLVDPDGMSVDNYDVYSNGKMAVERTDDLTDSFTYYDKDGNIHDLGVFNKNENGYIQLPKNYSYNKGKLSIGFQTKGGASRSEMYINPAVLGSIFGALGENNTSDLFITRASNSDGSSPGSSSSHIGGNALDIRYLRGDGLNGRVQFPSSSISIERNGSLIKSLRKFGFSKFLSEHYSFDKNIWINSTYPFRSKEITSKIEHKIEGTTHYRRGRTRHHHHLHIGGKWGGKIQYNSPIIRDYRNIQPIPFLPVDLLK